jgi:GxxExxY protein
MIPFEPVPTAVERVAKEVVDAAYRVHKALGPGLLESVYEVSLAHELRQRKLVVATQVALPVVYDGARLDAGLRLDMLVATDLRISNATFLSLRGAKRRGNLPQEDRHGPLAPAVTLAYHYLGEAQ